MITAKVISVMTAPHGRDVHVFAQAQTLISPENPRGEVMFYASPRFFAGGRKPYAGQSVMIGHVERKTSPTWARPKWRAFDVSPAQSVENHALKRLHKPTMLSQPTSGLFGRILAAIGIRSLSVLKLN